MDASLATVLILPKLDEAERQDVYTLCVFVHALVWPSYPAKGPLTDVVMACEIRGAEAAEISFS